MHLSSNETYMRNKETCKEAHMSNEETYKETYMGSKETYNETDMIPGGGRPTKHL